MRRTCALVEMSWAFDNDSFERVGVVNVNVPLDRHVETPVGHLAVCLCDSPHTIFAFRFFVSCEFSEGCQGPR